MVVAVTWTKPNASCPAWAPIVVSLALVVSGLGATRRLRAGRTLAVSLTHALAALVGGALVIVSFLVDANRVLGDDSSPWTGWPIFWAGMALAAAATVAALTGQSIVPRRLRSPQLHGSERRPSVGAPD